MNTATIEAQLNGHPFRTRRFASIEALAAAYNLQVGDNGHLLNQYGVFVGRAQVVRAAV